MYVRIKVVLTKLQKDVIMFQYGKNIDLTLFFHIRY